ncbi:MAG: hypothetical protein E6J41_31275 [Chloroflexi bacterium]|nr:MAG: hypothetical protein E6J41_31275 [Chloroflexota bacterium]
MRDTQEAVLAEMRRWGYRYVVTPTLERLDALALGLDADERRRLFKLMDADGSVLALVGERTVPVARLVAGSLRAAPLPLRLCYAGPVLTNDPGRFTRRREAYQVGAELVGASGPVADAEVIALAVRCLDAAGLRRYQVDVGHSEFFLGLLDGLALPADLKPDVRAALAQRDFVALEALLAGTPLRSAEHELLLRFPALRGDAGILDAAGALVRNRRSERALEELARVHELLRAHGLGAAVSLDLGSIRNFPAGMLRPARPRHRVHDPPRPDGEVLRLSGATGGLTRLDVAVAWSPAGLEAALRLAGSLRMFGMRAVLDTEPRRLAAALEWRSALGAAHLLHVGGGPTVAWSAGASSRVRRLPAEQVVARLAEPDG